MPTEDGHRYLPSTAIFLTEVCKLLLCAVVALYQTPDAKLQNIPSALGKLCHAIIAGDSWKLFIPGTIYTLANTLQYVAISNLDAASYQVIYQLKIIFTAVFSVLMLRKSLSLLQWIALVLLMVGVSIVSLPDDGRNGTLPSSHHLGVYFPGPAELRRQFLRLISSGSTRKVKRSATYQGILEDELELGGEQINTMSGVAAVIGVTFTSAFAGVFFEKVMKQAVSPPSMWIRNVQLSFWSLIPAFFIGVLFFDGAEVARYGFFDGYNWVVYLSIFIQAVGGALAAFVIYYADNIAKNFAVSISMILSSLASFLFFGFHFTPTVSHWMSSSIPRQILTVAVLNWHSNCARCNISV